MGNWLSHEERQNEKDWKQAHEFLFHSFILEGLGKIKEDGIGNENFVIFSDETASERKYIINTRPSWSKSMLTIYETHVYPKIL